MGGIREAPTVSGRKKLLMIDDDVNPVNVFRLVCEAQGYEFHAAHSAEEGIARIPEVEPDLIILDVIMRGGVVAHQTRGCKDPN